MAALTSLLPAPQRRDLYHEEVEEERPAAAAASGPKKGPPPYGARIGWTPRALEDYGGGGAFPEIHVAQYPMDMGRKTGSSASTAVILASQLDDEGKTDFGKIAEYGHRKGEIVYSRFRDLVPSNVEYKDEDLARPDEEIEAAVTERTRAALSGIVDTKIAARTTSSAVQAKEDPTYVKYTPSTQGPGHNVNIDQRVIRIVTASVDPLEPAKHRHKKLARGPGSPPVPVLHSPPRKLSSKDMENWKIPPTVSNWKNAKGYTIPLDKRLAADGRNLQEHVVNDNFAKLSEALYIAERKAREEIEVRDKIRKQMLLKEKAAKEDELRRLAMHAREERAMATQSLAPEEAEDVSRREEIREERRRERERDRRMEAAGKKTKTGRDRERDVSEKIALGQMPKGAAAEVMYDQRLFNQSEGVAQGFGDEDSYTVYDKPLFGGTSASAIYRPKAGDAEIYGGGEDLDKVLKTARFKPDKGFAGADAAPASAATGPRTAPVQFEREAEGDDPFGLGAFLDEAKRGTGEKRTNALDAIGKRGMMHAAADGGTGAQAGLDKADLARKRRMDFE